MKLEFSGNAARIKGLTPQGIGAEVAGAAAAARTTAIAYTNEQLGNLSIYSIPQLNFFLQQRTITAFRKNISSINLTGSTSETTLFADNFYQGDYSENGIFEIYALFQFTNNANAKTIKFKFNGIDILSLNAASMRSLQIKKTISNCNSKTAQISSALNSISDTGSSTSDTTNFSINTADGVELKITAKLATATDSIILKSCYGRVTY